VSFTQKTRHLTLEKPFSRISAIPLFLRRFRRS
jgi:hypothetical protein